MATAWTRPLVQEETTRTTCVQEMRATSAVSRRPLTNLLARTSEDVVWTSVPVRERSELDCVGLSQQQLGLNTGLICRNQGTFRCCIEDELVDDCSEENQGPGPWADSSAQGKGTLSQSQYNCIL